MPNPGEGSCLFYAVIQASGGKCYETNADKLRRETVRMVADDIVKAGGTPEEAEAYRATMEKASEFGNRAEAATALELMNLRGEVT